MIAESKGFTATQALLTQPLVQRAMAMGTKPWNRSKVMLVGEGRVGKTALCNSMIGKPFEETESTAGLTQLTCDIRRAAATNSGRWTQYMKPDREYEAGLAQLVRNIEAMDPPTIEEKSVSTTNNYLRHQHVPRPGNIRLNPRCGESDQNLFPHGSPRMTKIIPLASEKDRVHRTVVPNQPDTTLVMKCLADVKTNESNLILSLFDFGGQSVFNIIHHLFLTSYGVYVVVFNMVDILDDNKREQAFSEMSFWINSIVMHTRNVMTNKIAPVFLVGTHKDMVSNISNHRRISELIIERFRYHAIWPSIQEEDELCFYAVNNLLGLGDNAILDLMIAIECAVKDADYVNAPRPLTWLKALDELVATKKSFLTLAEASCLAVGNGVEEGAVPLFLSFLNEMGVVLWLDETGLRDVVILDVISFFVEPATLIICNHISQPFDSTIHYKKIQELCRKNRAIEWDEMTQRGLVSQPLMEFLLSHRVEANILPVIINLMLKYGLIVKLEQTHDLISQANPSPVYYLVPALLPTIIRDPSIFTDNSMWNHVKNFNSCYFVFSTASNLSSLQSISSLRLRKECFLPRGLMERLICKAVKWSQLTNITNVYDVAQVYQNYAALSYGRQQFRLVCIPELNCIRLDVEGEHPLAVYGRLYEQIKVCVQECMGSLQFITALRLGASSGLDEGFTLLALETVRKVHDTDIVLTISTYPPIDCQNVCNSYGPWLINKDILPYYDVFISHRWHDEDDVVIDQLYDAFIGCTVASEKRAVQVFYDKVRLKECQQFQKAFGKALINSIILVPILCTTALHKMLTHSATEEDNVLIEWILALECMQDPIHSKIRGIYPLMFGYRKEDGSAGNLFADGVINRLPEIIPTASIEVIKRLLEENGVTMSSSLATRTVRGVVREISKYLGLKGWEHPNGFTSVALKDIVNRIDDHVMSSAEMITTFTGDYQSVLEYARGYTPPKSCREYMLEDLPSALPDVKNLRETIRLSQDFISKCPNLYGLSPDEVLAVVAYSSNSDSGKENNLYHHINNVLRLKKNEPLSLLKPYLSFFISAMNKLPAVKTTVYRAVPIDGDVSEVIERYDVGTKVHWNAITATSTNVAIALRLRERGRPVIIFQFHVINGRNLSQYSKHPNDTEILLSPNSSFAIFETYFADYVDNESIFLKMEKSNLFLIKLIELKDHIPLLF